MTPSYPTSISGLAKPRTELGLGWVITSYMVALDAIDLVLVSQTAVRGISSALKYEDTNV